MAKHIAITGACGFIGQQLVPLLEAEGCELILVSSESDDLVEKLKGSDALLHLETLDHDLQPPTVDFMKVNVEGLRAIADAAKAAKVPLLIYPSALQATANGGDDQHSNASSVDFLSDVKGIRIVKLLWPIVYGQGYIGKLVLPASLSKILSVVLFPISASMKPTVHVNQLAKSVNLALDDAAPKEILLTDQQLGNWFYVFVRRIIDACFALGILIIFFWFLLGIWIAVRVTSKGPGIFAQQRVGQFGRIFTLYKFRTMKMGTTQAGTHEVSSAFLTPIGKFLRKTKIDELPQIWNILQGDISLIGPRPSLPTQTELVEARKARNVLDILPGITGYAQVRQIDMSDPDRLARADEEYMKLRTLPLDFKILIETFLGRGNGDQIGR